MGQHSFDAGNELGGRFWLFQSRTIDQAVFKISCVCRRMYLFMLSPNVFLPVHISKENSFRIKTQACSSSEQSFLS